VGTWQLATHPALPAIRLEDADGVDIGRLLGWPVDRSSGLVTSTHRLSVREGTGGWFDRVEDDLYRLGLSFLAIVIGPDAGRLYLDPSGSVPAVFSTEQRAVASTPLLLPDPEPRLRGSLNTVVAIPSRDNWYPFGLTPWEGVDRVLPNHFLDLRTFEAIRHWPRDHLGSETDLATATETVGETLTHQVAAVAAHHPIQMSLTAGRDTRVLLAAARRIADRLSFFTTPIPDRSGRVDVSIAEAISRTHGLAHRTLVYETATEQQLGEWLERVGHCCAGRTWRSVLTLQSLDATAAWLPGLGGEVARAYYWKAHPASEVFGTPETLVGALRLPPHPEIHQRAALWAETLPLTGPEQALDLLYIEQRLGCWASPQNLGHTGVAFRAFPFNHRRIFTEMLTLPTPVRHQQQLSTAIVEHRWPELLRFPFNEPPGLAGTLYRTARRARSMLKRPRGVR
jgi:hypothetical protein